MYTLMYFVMFTMLRLFLVRFYENQHYGKICVKFSVDCAKFLRLSEDLSKIGYNKKPV